MSLNQKLQSLKMVELKKKNKKIFLSKFHRLLFFNFVKMGGLLNYIKKSPPQACVISYVSTNLSMLNVVLYCLRHKIPYATWRCG